jgi:hypothetical protein
VNTGAITALEMAHAFRPSWQAPQPPDVVIRPSRIGRAALEH